MSIILSHNKEQRQLLLESRGVQALIAVDKLAIPGGGHPMVVRPEGEKLYQASTSRQVGVLRNEYEYTLEKILLKRGRAYGYSDPPPTDVEVSLRFETLVVERGTTELPWEYHNPTLVVHDDGRIQFHPTMWGRPIVGSVVKVLPEHYHRPAAAIICLAHCRALPTGLIIEEPDHSAMVAVYYQGRYVADVQTKHGWALANVDFRGDVFPRGPQKFIEFMSEQTEERER